MGKSFSRLERVLNLEAQQGYQNKAVVGGIRQFVTFWVEKAREDAVDEADRALVEQVSEVLMDYGGLSGIEARKKAITNLQERIKQRDERVGDKAPVDKKKSAPQPPQSKPQKSTPQPPPTPKVAEKKEAQETPSKPTPPPKSQPEPEPKPQEPDVAGLSQSVLTIKGIGPKIKEQLERLGVKTIWDLLYVFPRRYDDYTLMKPIKELVYGDQVTVIGTIWETRSRRSRNNQVVVQSVISDGSAKVQATWFNQPWLADKLKSGEQIVISGTVEQFLGRLVFNNPQWEPLELEPLRTRRIVPIYPLTQGLHSKKMRTIMKTAVADWSPRLPEPLPDAIRQRCDLDRIDKTLRQVHFPESQDTLYRARRRLIFDELFLLQLGMQGQRHEWRSQPGLPIESDPAILIRFHNSLPFELTKAQKRVINEIESDMKHDVPMNRLLQGDVGSGKTLVAAAALIIAAKSGMQAALMVPTEILAEQHYQSLNELLSSQDVSVALLTGSTATAEKERIYAGLADGTIEVVIGTHALIQPNVAFKKLALAVIDEQHRFGVDQRAALRDKGAETSVGKVNPHLLVMSATPIPRSLALSLYGDLDMSILDEMPPGRQEIKTRWLKSSERERAYTFIRRQVGEGQQAYIIYPLVEESDKIDAGSAVEAYERLQKEVFPELTVGLVHGRLRSDEKEAVMRSFYEGETNILVATSVIEVGVDVPNSTIMLIEDANRFGLAQLHQFRGRVGRGEHQSYCILLADSETGTAEERLRALEQSNDGFVLAEKDLEIRGPGEFFGRRQSGIPELQLASLLDMDMLQLARTEAEKLFQADPLLEQPEHTYLREQVAHFWEAAGDVS